MPDSEHNRQDVLLLAQQITAWAETVKEQYPYAKPLTVQKSWAYDLCKKHGPDGAMERLTLWWEESKRNVQRERQRDTFQQDLERERQARVRRSVEEHRRQDPPWARLEAAHLQAQLLLDGATAKLDGDMVSGGVEHPSRVLRAVEPPITDLILAKAEACARECERMVDRQARRVFDSAAPADERLVRMAGLTPEQVSRRDPNLGGPDKVRSLRKQLGLNAETGAEERAA